MGAKWKWSEFNRVAPYLKTLPRGITFFTLSWCDVERTPGNVNWDYTDSVVQRASRIDFTMMLKIRVGRCWATRDPVSPTGAPSTASAIPRSMPQYGQFVQDVVTRYSPLGVREYAIENEANSLKWWSGGPRQYLKLVEVASEAVHRADPHAEVVDSGISSVASADGVATWLLDRGETQQAVVAYNAYLAYRFGTRGQQLAKVLNVAQLRQALATSQGKRNLSFLATTDRMVRTGLVDVRQVHFYERWSVLPLLMTYLRAHTPRTVPLEMWELGLFCPTSRISETERKAEMIKTTALALSEGVTTVIWLPLTSALVSHEQLSGLLGAEARIGPSAAVYASLAGEAVRTGTTTVSIDGKGMLGVGFDNGHNSTMVVWWANPRHRVALPLSARVRPLVVTPEPALKDRFEVGPLPVGVSLKVSVSQFVRGL